MTRKQPLVAAMTDLLQQEAALLDQMLDVLKGEHTALGARDVAALEELAAQKQALAGRLEALGSAREALITEAGYPPGAESLAQLLRRTGDAELDSAWEQVRERALACQEHNTVNGRIIDLGRINTQRALNILRGEGESDVYDPSGSTESHRKTVRLGTV